MKILVTGAAGFIGYHLCNLLINNGLDVVGLDNLQDTACKNLKNERLSLLGVEDSAHTEPVKGFENFSFVKCDIKDKEALHKLFAGNHFDMVIHLAASTGVRNSVSHPEGYIQNNIIGFQNVIQACKEFGIKNLIYASSSSVYGQNPSMPYAEDFATDKPVSVYALTKKANELMASLYAELYGIRSVGLRFFTVYGPWVRADMASYIFMNAIAEDKPIQMFNDGLSLRDYTYVDDVVECIRRIVFKMTETETENRPLCEIFNVGNSHPVNLMDFLGCIEKQFNKKSHIIYMPIQEGDVTATYANVSKIFRYTGFRPDTPIEKGVARMAEWFLNHYRK